MVEHGNIGPHVAEVARKILASKPHPEMGYRLVAGLGRRGATVRELARLYAAWRQAEPALQLVALAEQCRERPGHRPGPLEAGGGSSGTTVRTAAYHALPINANVEVPE